MNELEADTTQNDYIFEFKVNCLTNGHLKTISLLLMIIISIVDVCNENPNFSYFSKTLLKYIGLWLSFSVFFFFYILGRNFYFSSPFKFRHVLFSSISKYFPLFMCILFGVFPVSTYFLPELPKWTSRGVYVDDNIGFKRFYGLYIDYMKYSLSSNFLRSKLINAIMFWISIPLIKIILFPIAVSILCSSQKIRNMKEHAPNDSSLSNNEINDALLLDKEELKTHRIVRKESHLRELYEELENTHSFSKRFRFFTILWTNILFIFFHLFIVAINNGRAIQVTYPLRLCWVYILCIQLFGFADLLTSLVHNYNTCIIFHIFIGAFVYIIPCLFTYDKNHVVAKFYSYSCFFIFGVWDSSLEFITGKGSIHHFRFSTLIKILIGSIVIYSIATGSKLLWLYDVYYNSEMTPRLENIGSLGIAISTYYLSNKKTILIKRRYKWIDKLRSKFSTDPAVFFFLNFIPSKKTLWEVLKKDSFKVLAFVPIVTSVIVYIQTEKFLFGAFESFLTVLFFSPTICILLMNIPQIYSHVSSLLK
ncbi:hypothetical protein FG386_003386 [Cryptosporidium ryanae]|uniref:uncharacterized protein n=1 Tax=Cryptosporidium ryanae TaxID=515981 RepID=UPI00351AAD1C|nr:hypothetical protein FG386_003386 [Cryptosporidium ryanae]